MGVDAGGITRGGDSVCGCCELGILTQMCLSSLLLWLCCMVSAFFLWKVLAFDSAGKVSFWK